jgi:hypothetical protein
MRARGPKQQSLLVLTVKGMALGGALLLQAPLHGPAWAEEPPGVSKQEDPPPGPEPTSLTMFTHPAQTRWWVSGQMNFIFQTHPSFPAKYNGVNSLRSEAEHATSRLLTLYSGLQLGRRSELLLSLEETGGSGLSDALGTAGDPNLDVVRNPLLSKAPYVARAAFHHVIPIGRESVDVTRGPLQVLSHLPARRLDLRIGKMGLVDFFDPNSIGSDSHLQFMNWAVDQNGAFDYAADTRGYTFALIAEYTDHFWSGRFGEALMPKVANGIDLDWDVAHDRGENLEFELHRGFLPGRDGAWRLLGYVNRARMGNYRESIDAALAVPGSIPDVEATRQKGRTKYGLGVNVEQAVTDSLRVFGRWGWSDGKNETFAYTEIDQTWLFGGDLRGTAWQRPQDKLGLAFVSNAISPDHREYLALGGRGFILGDGALNYGRETIVESYYTIHVWKGVFVAPGLQYIRNPGYNRDRGPVWIPGLRFHLDL